MKATIHMFENSPRTPYYGCRVTVHDDSFPVTVTFQDGPVISKARQFLLANGFSASDDIQVDWSAIDLLEAF